MDTLYSAIDPSKPIDKPKELLVLTGYLSNQACQWLVAYSGLSDDKGAATIGDLDNGGSAKQTKSEGFNAERIDFHSLPLMREKGISICADIYQNRVGPYYGTEIEWFEFPHILRYGPGGTYGLHSDAYNYVPDKNLWVKVVNRDYSTVLYLNSSFEGGALAFPKYNLRIKPQTGMLVTFPSDNRFVHTAESTLSGTRLAFVTWAAKKGGERVPGAPHAKIVRLQHRE